MLKGKLIERIFNLRGTWGAVVGSVVAAGTAYYNNQQANKRAKSASGMYGDLSVPEFQTNSDYTKAYSDLSTTGNNLMNGTLPGFYSNLGKPNSDAFKGTVENVKGQLNQGSAESAAASGTDRSGVAQTAAASALGNVLPQMTYQDYLNSQSQQMSLLNQGIGIEGNLAGLSQNQEAMQNNYQVGAFNQQMNLTGQQWNQGQQIAQQQGSAMGNILQAIIGTNNTTPSKTGLIGGLGGMFNQSPSTSSSSFDFGSGSGTGSSTDLLN